MNPPPRVARFPTTTRFLKIQTEQIARRPVRGTKGVW